MSPFFSTAGSGRNGASLSEQQRLDGPQPYLMPAFDELGYNYRMTDIQAAIGLVQLGKMDGFIEQRTRWADYYARELAAVAWLRTPAAPDGVSHAWQSYVCIVDEATAPRPRNEIMAQLRDRGIATPPVGSGRLLPGLPSRIPL